MICTYGHTKSSDDQKHQLAAMHLHFLPIRIIFLLQMHPPAPLFWTMSLTAVLLIISAALYVTIQKLVKILSFQNMVEEPDLSLGW